MGRKINGIRKERIGTKIEEREVWEIVNSWKRTTRRKRSPK